MNTEELIAAVNIIDTLSKKWGVTFVPPYDLVHKPSIKLYENVVYSRITLEPITLAGEELHYTAGGIKYEWCGSSWEERKDPREDRVIDFVIHAIDGTPKFDVGDFRLACGNGYAALKTPNYCMQMAAKLLPAVISAPLLIAAAVPVPAPAAIPAATPAPPTTAPVSPAIPAAVPVAGSSGDTSVCNILPNRSVEYRNILRGTLHRVDGPAVIDPNGDRFWYLDGELHREDGPAQELADGVCRWYQHGRLHRADGPAITLPCGSKYWYNRGDLHRADGPAVELADGTSKWYRGGLLHRLDGPAVELPDGTCKWYCNGIETVMARGSLKKA